MTSRVGPRAAGTNGSDFKHRERVAPHYQMRQVPFYLFLILVIIYECYYLWIARTSTKITNKSCCLIPVLQCFPEVWGTEVKSGPPSHLAAGGSTGDCQPLQPGVTWHSVHAVPVGVPLPSQPPPPSLQQPVTSKEQYQLPGHIHDQRRTVLCGTSDLWWNGDVSCSAAALPPWKGLSLHFWLLCSDCYVPHHGDCCSGACLAAILHEKALRLMVQYHSGEEEEIMEWRKLTGQNCVFILIYT